jgi:hypothetical protein
VLDGQAKDIYYGKLGAKKSMEMSKDKQKQNGMRVSGVVVGGGVSGILKDFLSTIGSDGKDGKILNKD